MKKTILFVLCVVFWSCSSPRISQNDLEFRDFRYSTRTNHKPFNGEAVTKFENGQISNVIEFKNGIPDGSWGAYGYEGEIVQTGNYTPIIFNNSNHPFGNNVKRINVCFLEEGTFKSNDVLLVLDKLIKDSLEANALKKNVLKYLNANTNILQDGTLENIKIVKDELEMSN